MLRISSDVVFSFCVDELFVITGNEFAGVYTTVSCKTSIDRPLNLLLTTTLKNFKISPTPPLKSSAESKFHLYILIVYFFWISFYNFFGMKFFMYTIFPASNSKTKGQIWIYTSFKITWFAFMWHIARACIPLHMTWTILLQLPLRSNIKLCVLPLVTSGVINVSRSITTNLKNVNNHLWRIRTKYPWNDKSSINIWRVILKLHFNLNGK